MYQQGLSTNSPGVGGFCEISGNPSWFLAAPSWRPLGLLTFSPLPGSPSDDALMPALTSPDTRHISSVVPQDSAPSSSPPQGLCPHIPNTSACPASGSAFPMHLPWPRSSAMSRNYCFNVGDGEIEAQRGGNIYLKSHSYMDFCNILLPIPPFCLRAHIEPHPGFQAPRKEHRVQSLALPRNTSEAEFQARDLDSDESGFKLRLCH